jgi:predicted HAD superfamily Cof-like phosphohydrolase
MYKLVRAFHKAFGHPAPARPTLIDPARLAVRRKWADEERAEFDEAFAKGDLLGCADALADELYFLLGTCVEMGLDMDEILLAVHASNMGKLQHDGPHAEGCGIATGRCTCGKIIYNDLGKVIKPEGWTPPEPRIAAILATKVWL